MADCNLCALAAGRDRALRLYEDESAVVILRLQEGHAALLLVVPRRHAGSATELGPDLRAHLLKIGLRASRSLLDAGIDLGHATPQLLERDEHVHVRLPAA